MPILVLGSGLRARGPKRRRSQKFHSTRKRLEKLHDYERWANGVLRAIRALGFSSRPTQHWIRLSVTASIRRSCAFVALLEASHYHKGSLGASGMSRDKARTNSRPGLDLLYAAKPAMSAARASPF